MKIVLSRKGFDSSTGGVPSPIFPSGALCPLPIPEAAPQPHGCRYRDLRAGDPPVGEVVQALTGGRISAEQQVHLDPDLAPAALPRRPGWRPLFGQAGAAEGHLRRCEIGPGDLFLFYGWFRRVTVEGDRLRYVPNAPDQHILFGWFQIEQRLPASAVPGWARYHPHWNRTGGNGHNVIYVATDRLHLRGIQQPYPGAGLFPHIHPDLILTAPGRKRSLWRLPAWFYPDGRPSVLTYHHRRDRWTPDGDTVLLQTVGRGQEFVLDCAHYPEAIEWIATLFDQTSPALTNPCL